MKHPYTADCTCPRCAKELVRRTQQSLANPQYVAPKPRKARRTRKPEWGSQEWAETHGDDLGYSGDY